MAERWDHGIRLVAVDERGNRQFPLITAPDGFVHDTHPAISPDHAWLVFVSNRGRGSADTSLWIAPLGVEAVPIQLTEARGTDNFPVWTPDGGAIVFAPTRDSGDCNLWRLAIDHGRAAGAPVQLTDSPGCEIAPTIALDGTIIYTSGSITEPREQHLEARAPDGVVRKLTAGPSDVAPALSPDGSQVAFARPVRRAGAADLDLWVMPTAGGGAVHLLDAPVTDESGPVWSRDGRYVFATSVFRASDGSPLVSSVIFVDMRETPRRARMLVDHGGAAPRLTPALVSALDGATLALSPAYATELERILANALAAQGEPSATQPQ